MATGKVKWFNNAKGYGFILPEQGGEDLFAHFSTIVMEGYKTLRAGQDVVFDVETGPKGLHAVNIRALQDNGFAKANGAAQANGGVENAGAAGARHDPLLANGASATLV